MPAYITQDVKANHKGATRKCFISLEFAKKVILTALMTPVMSFYRFSETGDVGGVVKQIGLLEIQI